LLSRKDDTAKKIILMVAQAESAKDALMII
jgi:hypothetical protein